MQFYSNVHHELVDKETTKHYGLSFLFSPALQFDLDKKDFSILLKIH